jgi:hypothetical protein
VRARQRRFPTEFPKAELAFRTPQRSRVHGRRPINRQVLECARASAAFAPKPEFDGHMPKSPAPRKQLTGSAFDKRCLWRKNRVGAENVE